MAAMTQPILFWNRNESKIEEELIYGDKAVRWLYENPVGQELTERFLTRKLLSKVYGKYQSSGLSRHKIEPFIQQFRIRMEEFETGPFKSFNEFFIRKFKDGAREFVSTPSEMPAFCEARYLAFSRVTAAQEFPIKGKSLSASGLISNSKWAKTFEGGPLLLARLCPTDYHRFHFPDSGKVVDSYSVNGRLHSVNPIALKYDDEIFLTNERRVSILETENFGKLAYVEVGALCVGHIVQSHSEENFKRGDEKGYFLFGGSTVILLGEPGKWTPHADLLAQTQKGRETLVKLGEAVASA